MTIKVAQTAEEAVKELATLVRQHVEDLERRHHMINLLAGIGSALFVLREELQEARDAAAELLELASNNSGCTAPQ